MKKVFNVYMLLIQERRITEQKLICVCDNKEEAEAFICSPYFNVEKYLPIGLPQYVGFSVRIVEEYMKNTPAIS